jgi:hypothetical protein
MGAEWRPVSRTNGSSTTFVTTFATPPRQVEMPSSVPPAPLAQPRWSGPATTPQVERVFASNEEVRRIIANTLGTRLSPEFRLFLGDNRYYLPPLADAQQIIANSGLARAEYMPETFDCDDFALVLKAHFCEAAYKNFQRRPPHCMGMIWGELPHVHAINWMINSDYRLRLIEPQTGEVFEIKPEHKNVTFMLA